MVTIFYLDPNTQLTNNMIQKYIEVFRTKYLPKLITNKKFYDVKNPPIMNRVYTDVTKPQNRIPTAWSRYVTTLLTGYFLGRPVTYSIPTEELSTIINMNSNKEISHNASLEKDCSIYGIAYELLYLNENKQLQYTKLSPETVIPIYDNSIDGELLYAIRFWEDTDILNNKTITNIELYTKEDIKIFKQENSTITLVEVKTHYFKEIQINVFKNNEDLTGDSECVQNLISNYDNMLTDTANFRQELNDSYLVFKNCDLDDAEILKMKSNRIFSIDSGTESGNASIEWLNKDTNDIENENYKNRLAEDIKKFSFVSDLETVSTSHITSESVKMGTLGIEQIVSEKENYYRIALIRRLQLICNIYNLFGNDFNTDDVKITFVRNIPQNLSTLSDSLIKLKNICSNKTLIAQIPFISDLDAELKQLEEERKQNEQQNEQDE